MQRVCQRSAFAISSAEIAVRRTSQKSLLEGVETVTGKYGISVDAILVKAKQIGIISEASHRSLCIELNRNPELKQRVQASVYHKEESSRFERLVYKALSDNLITVSKAADLLDCSVDQVNAQLTLA